jgi:hypothetical protein
LDKRSIELKIEQPYKLIDDISLLSHEKFVSCICDSNLKVLVISGEPSPEDLLECWANLYAQYLDLAADAESLYFIILQKEIQILKYKVTAAEAILPVISFFHVGELVAALKQLGFETKTLQQGHHGYEHGIKKVKAKVAHLKLKLQQKIQELAASDQGEHEAVSREYFTRQLVKLSKFQGYPLKSRKLMMTDYIAILKEFIDYLQAKQNVLEDGKAW